MKQIGKENYVFPLQIFLRYSYNFYILIGYFFEVHYAVVHQGERQQIKQLEKIWLHVSIHINQRHRVMMILVVQNDIQVEHPRKKICHQEGKYIYNQYIYSYNFNCVI